MRSVLLATAALLLTTSALHAQKAPVRERIDTVVAAPKDRAVERTVAAFVSEGLTVAKNEGGVIQSEPVDLKSIGMTIGIITYTATVVTESDSTSRVIVQALQQEVTDGTPRGTKRAVRSSDKAMYRQHWARVEAIAAAVAQ